MSRMPLRFEFIPYPLWRRRAPAPIHLAARAILRRTYPLAEDNHPPAAPEAMAKWLARWGLLGGGQAAFVGERAVIQGLRDSQARIDTARPAPLQDAPDTPLRLPAQWEPMEKVLISWAWMYPPLWEMHARMVEAISPVCDVELLVPDAMWAHAVWLVLSWRGEADMDRVRFLVLPTNDVWIRDYGPLVGLDPNGNRVAVSAIYDPLPAYPQADDNSMSARWAAHHGIPLRRWNMHSEGGNLWSDGRGTLLMSEQIFYSNRYHDRAAVLQSLHSVFDFQKAIITPRLTLEETGHVDLVMKLAGPQTILVSSARSLTTGTVLRKARRQMERETSAAGQPYRVMELPTPPLYLNWFVYSIRRAYTNALTVNGRVLVPVFGLPQDEEALRVYEEAMPDHEVIPIDSRAAINGGGAVHCMTKEIPAPQ